MKNFSRKLQSLLIAVIIPLSLSSSYNHTATTKHYYCTSADSKFFPNIMSLIRSIKKNDAKNLGEIAVFNLGFTNNQLRKLKQTKGVKVFNIRMAHPDLLKYFITSPQRRRVRGWFAWKPVAIKQALERYPYILYVDSSFIIYKSPKDIFRHIIQEGYFLVGAGENSTIESRITKPVIEKLLNPLSPEVKKNIMKPGLETISAGFQGLSRKVLKDYVLPVYDCTSDLSLFADDGSARLGFGAGRHDQIIFSIYAYLNNMKIYQAGWNELVINGKSVPCHIHWNKSQVAKDTVILY